MALRLFHHSYHLPTLPGQLSWKYILQSLLFQTNTRFYLHLCETACDTVFLKWSLTEFTDRSQDSLTETQGLALQEGSVNFLKLQSSVLYDEHVIFLGQTTFSIKFLGESGIQHNDYFFIWVMLGGKRLTSAILLWLKEFLGLYERSIFQAKLVKFYFKAESLSWSYTLVFFYIEHTLHAEGVTTIKANGNQWSCPWRDSTSQPHTSVLPLLQHSMGSTTDMPYSVPPLSPLYLSWKLQNHL